MGARLLLFLHKHRKGAALAFAVLTAAVCLPLMDVFSAPLPRAVLTGVLAAHALLALLLAVRGAASAVKWGVRYLLAAGVCAAGAGMTLRFGLRGLPGFAVPACAAAVLVLLLLVLRLPERAAILAGRMLRRAAAARQRTAETPAQRSTYAQMMVQKVAGIYLSKPYAVAACSEGMRRLRVLAMLGLGALGLALLLLLACGRLLRLVSACLEGTVLLAAVAAVVWGACIFLFGFARAALVWPCAAAGYLAARGVMLLLAWAGAVSPVFCAVLAAGMVFAAAGLLLRLFRLLVVHFSTTFWQFERGGALCAADLPLEDVAPLEGFDCFTTLEARLPERLSSEDSGRVFGFLQDFLVFSRLRRLVFCGWRLDAPARRVTLYYYAESEARAHRLLRAFLRRRERMETTVVCARDVEWSRFFTEVYPAEEEYQHIHNRFFYDMMERDGFDFGQAMPQLYYFYFEQEKDARAFARDAREEGFERVRYLGGETMPRRFGTVEKGAVALCAQMTGRLGLARMDLNTAHAVALARRYNGHFGDWELGELDEQEAQTQGAV